MILYIIAGLYIFGLFVAIWFDDEKELNSVV